MVIKVLKNQKLVSYEHMNLLNVPSAVLSPDALKIKAAAAAWVNGEFTLDEILEAIAEKLFSGSVSEDFEGREWDCWSAYDYLIDCWGDVNISHSREQIYENEKETSVVDIEYQIQSSEEEVVKTEDLTTETEMETV